MTHPRATWTIEEYEAEMDRLLFLEADMNPAQFAEIKKLLETEMRERFSATERELRGIELEIDNES